MAFGVSSSVARRMVVVLSQVNGEGDVVALAQALGRE
jgi:hypothetical protein